MEMPQKSHIIKPCLIAILFFITPFLWPAMRPHYLYFLLNLLIIVIGAEAGLLSSLKPEDKNPTFSAPKSVESTTRFVPEAPSLQKVDCTASINNDLPKKMEMNMKEVAKCASEKAVSAVKVRSLKTCPSTPSILFIGDGENEENKIISDFDEEADEEYLSGQELYAKAETFIGNFYKQLKIQREDSWRKIHGLYHNAF